MTKIDNTQVEYNENILTTDFTFDNTFPWEFTVGSGIPGNIVGTSNEQHYVGNKSLKVYHTEYDSNAITISPVNSTEYSFTVPRTGYYNFSIRTFIQASVPWLPEVTGDINLYANGSGIPYHTFVLKAGNNSEPEFSYDYNKWQTFYDEVALIEGDIITLSIHLTYQSTFTPGILTMYFDGFKVEYMDDRVFEIPTLYTLPIN